jgi:hypothetical protein
MQRNAVSKRFLKEQNNIENIHCVAVVALKDIYDGDELYVDYFDASLY